MQTSGPHVYACTLCKFSDLLGNLLTSSPGFGEVDKAERSDTTSLSGEYTEAGILDANPTPG